MKRIILFMLPLLFLCVAAFRINNNMVVTGTVTDEKGLPVEGASVTVVGTRAGSATDAAGQFRLANVPENGKLRVTGIGFTATEVSVNSKSVVNITVIRVASSNAELTTITVGAFGLKTGDDYDAFTGQSPSSRGYYSVAKSLRKSNTFKDEEGNREGYGNISENGFHKVSDDPLSTFSIDVDAASYSNVRRFLNNNQLPPEGAVRTEEMINYFKYDYPQPAGKDPFSINTEMSECPWNSKNKLVLIGMQGKIIPTEDLPASNLVFLIDVSGSMDEENKLPLVKSSLKLLTDQLREKDRISIVVYAGNAGLVLPATSGADKTRIKAAIDALEAGGSTAGGAGIELAYKMAGENLMKDGNSRVILCTDGDFNVGESSDDAMVRLIEKERNNGIFLTVLGYGTGNYQDNKMQQLADKGNGNHSYIDNLSEAKKVLVNEFGGTLFTIAKDVKLQLEFNPAKVAGYRLIGYENRMLNKEDFNDDKKDAGEMGSGHTVTALYEIIPAGVTSEFLTGVDPLKYQKNNPENFAKANFKDELLTVKFRYKQPSSDKSDLIVHPVKDEMLSLKNTSDNFRFAAAVADFAMLLRNSKYAGGTNYEYALLLAAGAAGKDREGYRKEFIELIKKATNIYAKKNKKEEEDKSVGKAN